MTLSIEVVLLMLERERKRVARKKERRATLILGLIMGSFIACWFPFFFLYTIVGTQIIRCGHQHLLFVCVSCA